LFRTFLHFIAPYKIETAEEPIGALKKDEVLVASRLSAISAGTEMLLVRGDFPPDLPLDSVIPDFGKRFGYPLKYGYAVVGEVHDTGPGVEKAWTGKRVFAFHCHESHFAAHVQDLIILPDCLSWQDAVFLPFMETAVSLLFDGKPSIGEQVAVLGQGVVGLLTTALLARMDRARLITVDLYSLRRHLSVELGAHASLDASGDRIESEVRHALGKDLYDGADLTYEVSGNPEALNHAIAMTGFSGRIVIGSWYGLRRSFVDLGGYFHRSRIKIISSQVSTLTPESSGAWTKRRRFDLALRMLGLINPSRLITHTLTLEDAQLAYVTLDKEPDKTIQIVFEYQ
jgi:2-desacetyl-2-hydroxyethyl bacteriochlorophyllide A dehydrogenase